MERIIKLVVIASMGVALYIEAVLAARGWPGVLPLALATFVVALGIGSLWDEAGAAVVLLFAYTFPALLVLGHGRFEIGYTTVWMAGLFGVTLPRSVRTGWNLPARWRAPLALWALTVALVWPIVVLRELDFMPSLLDLDRQSLSGAGVAPQVGVVWILNVALTLGLGILWFEWLWSTFDHDEPRFRSRALAGLAASWVLAISVGIYQLFFNLEFVNSGRFASLQRASGTMLDANPFGVIAALGGPAIVAWRYLSPAVPRGLIVVVTAGAWLALWASGARTALATGVIGTLFVVYDLGRRVTREKPLGRRSQALIGVAAILVIIVTPVLLNALPAVGPWRRVRAMLPAEWSLASVLALGAELWNRNTYGAIATRMIRDFPFFGVGVGTFHVLVQDYSRVMYDGFVVPPDNAQNWFRHQLAEFGLIGSIGWMLWVVSFAWFVLGRRGPERTRLASGAVRGMIVALAFVSLLGMPTQNFAVTVTFWTLAFWYALLVGEGTPIVALSPDRRATWVAIVLVAVIAAGGTAYVAGHELRVAARASQFGWPYSHGFSSPETGPAGEFRWAERRGVIVLDAPKPWMKLTVSVNHADVARKPVDVKVWRDSEEVIRTTLHTIDPVTQYVHIPPGDKRIVLETEVNRVLRPADFGLSDPRELGLMVAWDFVDSPR